MRRFCHFVLLLCTLISVVVGCAVRRTEIEFAGDELSHFQEFANEIEYPDVDTTNYDDVLSTPAPMTLAQRGEAKYRDITLQQAIEIALTNADVLRDLQGLVLNSPDNVRTIKDPAIIETDPFVGVEAALSEFDAIFDAGAYFEKNDRALNNAFFGGGTRLLSQDLHLYRAQLSKKTATGAEYALRHNIEYDFNNAPGNNVPNLPWDINVEAEFRQPLMQGAGVAFNRIAGPNSIAGRPTGVLIARLNTDVGLADFELGVRDLISDVENAYWELYFAYRDLNAKIAARDQALETWRRLRPQFDNDRLDADKEALAREQYFRMQEEVENALAGPLPDQSRYDMFRGTGGVQSNERQLRLLIGLPAADGELLRPSDEPLMAKVIFDWNEVLVESLARRVELRRQKWQVKRGELELVAAENFLKPRLDAVGRYRWRGLGHTLLNPNTSDPYPFNNAYGNLTGGDFQEWQLGVELTAPIGFRQAHAAVRNAELSLARDRAILDEQQRNVVHELSEAYAEVDRTYIVSQTNYNRRMAARQQLAALQAQYDMTEQPKEKLRLLDLVLDAQRRLADSESRYYRSLCEYTLAIKRVHLRKGSLLDYSEVYLSEGPWPGKAYYDACQRESRRGHPKQLADFRLAQVPHVSAGVYAQDTVPADIPTPIVLPAPPLVPQEPTPLPQVDTPQPPAASVNEAPNPVHAAGLIRLSPPPILP